MGSGCAPSKPAEMPVPSEVPTPAPVPAQVSTTSGVTNSPQVVPAGGYTEGARVYHSVAQSIPTNTPTFLAFDSERYDTDNIHDTVTYNSILTCRTAGIYLITFTGRYAANVSGKRTWEIYLNHVTRLSEHTDDVDANGYFARTTATIYQLSVGDYVEVRAWQNSGVNVDVQSEGNFTPEFAMHRIG
ncbi:hypothetical protein ES703_117376 [subsurface metagenome]